MIMENCTVHLEKELENDKSRCKDLEERCTALELEIGSKKSEYELLDISFKALEVEKLVVEDELEVFKRKNNELEERIVRTEKESKIGGGGETAEERATDLTFENEDKIEQLLIENKVLECEKKKAEDDAEFWKEKVRELESRVVRLEKADLVLRGEECAMGGEIVASLEDIKTDKMREARKPKNGVSLDNVLSKEKVVDLDKTFCVSPSEGIGLSQIPGTSSIDTHLKHLWHIMGEKKETHSENAVVSGSHVRQQLIFKDEGSPNKKIAPSTPVGLRQLAGIIDISDSDDELHISKVSKLMPKVQRNMMASVSTNHEVGGAGGKEKRMNYENSLNRTLADQSDEEYSSGCKGNLLSRSTPKTKRASNVVTSDSDTDDDDKVPIGKLKRKHLQEAIHDPLVSHLNSCSTGANNVTGCVTPLRRRLVTLRQCEEGCGIERHSPSNIKTNRTNYETGVPTTEDVEDDKSEEFGSDSEGDNLDGFIVDSSSVSDTSGDNDVSDSGGDSNESEIVSDDNMDFDEILSTVKRTRDDKLNWEFEGDMLAAFGQKAEMCLKAVCALYRQQTSDEQIAKGTIHSNKRGFSQCDAPRGTTLAEFLLEGDPQGDLMRSVEELEAYDPNAVEQCRTLATRYSKQLFAIYKNKEDPYFCAS